MQRTGFYGMNISNLLFYDPIQPYSRLDFQHESLHQR